MRKVCASHPPICSRLETGFKECWLLMAGVCSLDDRLSSQKSFNWNHHIYNIRTFLNENKTNNGHRFYHGTCLIVR